MLRFDNDYNLLQLGGNYNFAEDKADTAAESAPTEGKAKSNWIKSALGKTGEFFKGAGSKAKGAAVATGSGIASRAKHALKGYNIGDKKDYAKNMGLRAVEGSIIGGGAGAVAGNLVGRAKRNKAGQAAKHAASQGLKNKLLNALNRNRLKDIESAAKKKVSLTKHTLAGAGIGAGAGAGIGAGAGAAETFLKHRGNESKWLKNAAKIAGEEGAKAMLKEAKGSADWKAKKKYIDAQGLTRSAR